MKLGVIIAVVMIWLAGNLVINYVYTNYLMVNIASDIAVNADQFDGEKDTQLRTQKFFREEIYGLIQLCWSLLFGIPLLLAGVTKMKKSLPLMLIGFLVFSSAACMKPFEPVDLQTIGTNEEAFLIPLIGDNKKQTSTNSEEFFKANLVYTKQVKIPQQWVKTGYEFLWYNGEWKPEATLIKVDRSPVTREWTADSNSGTSNKNQAVWVMTSDQVEFSTGWTCTARISSRDDAVKFLSNYPNGSLSDVLDREVRALIQTSFGLEVTDLPMDDIRKQATPHIKHVIDKTETFFKERGITITNLGISGGFVYKDASIQSKLVEVFNAEQEKNISIAKTQAQQEENKRISLEATAKGNAILIEKRAEAEGIQAVADAKAYEIGKAKEDFTTYLELKHIELEAKKTEKWDGRFPGFFVGGGATPLPSTLLKVPK